MKKIPQVWYVRPVFALLLPAMNAQAQSYRVQCPNSTLTHPDGASIKCQQIAGGDGYATMADGNTTYMFGFGPLSGLPEIYHGLPGTEPNSVFNTAFGPDTGTPSTLVGMPDGNFNFHGAIGLTEDFRLDPWAKGNVYLEGAPVRSGNGVYVASSHGTAGATAPTPPQTPGTLVNDGGVKWDYQGNLLDGHVDARPILDVGVMNANQPAPMIAIDEDDELFLTLSNVGMIMRPDLFEQHTVHFHGYPNAPSYFDAVPDASVAINIAGSFTYYYTAPDAGTYFWHCHITPPEHLQMGMEGQLYVRPRQNRLALGANLHDALAVYENPTLAATLPNAAPGKPAGYPNTSFPPEDCSKDVLCSTPVPPANTNVQAVDRSGTPAKYAYNDGDGSTRYDVEYPIQMMGFDPNFHFIGMTFNPEPFADMKDKYFLINGRSYTDNVSTGAIT